MHDLIRNSLGVSLLMVFLGCGQFENTENGDVPPPPYLDVTLTAENMPGIQTPASLIYDVAYVGRDGQPLISPDGDTVKYIWLYFETKDDVELLNVSADSVWYGFVNVGQTIHLEYEFQLTDVGIDPCCNSDPSFTACHYISLVARFFTTEQILTNKTMRSTAYTKAELFFNHLSGEYTFKNPYEIYQGGVR